MFALLCALTCAPGELRTRVCLVALGVIESPSCCPQPSCCDAIPDTGPAVKAVGDECHCCVDVLLDSKDRAPSKAPTQTGEIVAAPLLMICEFTSTPLPPPGWERARAMLVRGRLRLDVAALVPLRI